MEPLKEFVDKSQGPIHWNGEKIKNIIFANLSNFLLASLIMSLGDKPH